MNKKIFVLLSLFFFISCADKAKEEKIESLKTENQAKINAIEKTKETIQIFEDSLAKQKKELESLDMLVK